MAQNDCTYSYQEMAAYHRDEEVVHSYARHPKYDPNLYHKSLGNFILL